MIHDAQAAAGLRHPHLAAILDVGEDAGQLYVVTEPLGGGSLAERMVGGGLSRVQALEVAVQVAEALGFLHEHGLVHGNVGPDHVWLREDGTAALLLDFVATVALAPAALTRTGAALKSLPYLAPEQIQGRAADSRSDEFALGTLLYELMAGRQPFEAETPLAMAMRVLHDEVPAIQEVAPDVPTPLARAVGSLLQKRPEDRALDLEALRTALRVMRQQGGESAVQLAPPAAAAPPAPVPRPGISAEASPLAADEQVQFTVYRPRILEPGRWQTMLVFAHLAERRPDQDDEPDPAAEVARQAAAVLGDVAPYRHHTEDSAEPVPYQGDLTFVPFAEGIEFNPPSRSFRWTEMVHREEFRLRAPAALGNRVIHGRVTVYVGAIVLAEIGMALRVQAAAIGPREVPASDSARPYRQLFASYSHRDRAIVEEFSEYARAIGDRYLRDVVELRSGETWGPRLEGLIREADIFQLFWSWNALESAFVRQEWQYALSLGRDRFVRPVYWDEPLPARGDLPPPALRQLHFQQIRPMRWATAAPPLVPRAPRPGDTGAYAAVPPPAPPSPPAPVAPPTRSAQDPPTAYAPAGRTPVPRSAPSSPPPTPRVPRPSASPAPRDVAKDPRAGAPARASSWRGVLGAVAAIALVAIMLPTLWLSRRTGSTDLPSGTPAPTGVSPAPRDVGSNAASEGFAAAVEADRLWQRGDTWAAIVVIRRAANERPGNRAVEAQLSRMRTDAERRLRDARRASAGQAPRDSVAAAEAHERRAAALAREGRQVDAIAQLVAAAEIVERYAPASPRGGLVPERQPRRIAPP